MTLQGHGDGLEGGDYFWVSPIAVVRTTHQDRFSYMVSQSCLASILSSESRV